MSYKKLICHINIIYFPKIIILHNNELNEFDYENISTLNCPHHYIKIKIWYKNYYVNNQLLFIYRFICSSQV